MPAQSAERVTPVEVRLGRVRLERKCAIVAGNSFRVPTSGIERQPTVTPCFEKIWIDRQGAIIGLHGLPRAAEGDQQSGAMDVGTWSLRLVTDRAIEAF